MRISVRNLPWPHKNESQTMKQPIFLLPAVLLAAWITIFSSEAVAKAVRVFILAGQSNKEGQGFIAADPKRNGGKGSLEFLVKNPATAKHFGHLVDSTGK